MELMREKPKAKKPKKKTESSKIELVASEIKKLQIPKDDKLEQPAESTDSNFSSLINGNELKSSEDLKDSSIVLPPESSPMHEKTVSQNSCLIIDKNELKSQIIHDPSSMSSSEIKTNETNVSSIGNFYSEGNTKSITAESPISEKVIESSDIKLKVLGEKQISYLKSKCLYPQTTILEQKEKCSDILLQKINCDTSSEIKHVYPNLKSIERCEKIEDIESMRTIVQTYTEEYTNKVYNEALKRSHKFAVAVTGIENYPLFELTKEYQNARKMSNEARTRLKYLNSKLKAEKVNLWKLQKKEASSKGCCEDGSNVSVCKPYFVKELDDTKFCEVTELLRELEEVVLSYAFYSYSDELSKMKIQQYLYNMINYYNSSYDDGFNKKDVLKKCISVLFEYQRQSTKDKSFLEICQNWLKLLVHVLLQDGNQSDFLFIVDHLIRCPNGIQGWASQLLQFPGSAFCTEAKDILGCPCLYYVLLVLYLILNPAPDRDFFLRNVKRNASDPAAGEFLLLDSEGEEEELFEVIRHWTNEDIISLLNQISIASIYDHILFEKIGESCVIKYPSMERIKRMFAFSTSLINILFSGLNSYCKEEFTTSVECICSMIRHVVFYVSDHWEYCEQLDIPSKSALQAEYDRFIFHSIYIIFNFEKLGVWKFLASLPYKCVSKKMLWNILWIFHSSKSLEENVYLQKDIDLKLNDDVMISTFIEKLSSVDLAHSDQLYLLNTYKAISLYGNPEKELVCFIVHEVFEVTFGKNALHHLGVEGSVVLTCIMKKYPYLLTALLKEVELNADDAVSRSIVMFEELDLSEWVPTCDDVRFLRMCLLEFPLSSAKNFLGRLLLSKMNWDFSNKVELALPLELHRETAVLILEAYMKFDRKGNEWSVSNGLAQIIQFTTVGNYVREEEVFVRWAWNLLFTLKLHALDKKLPMWIQIYDGFMEMDFLPDPFKELWLQPLLKGYEEKHPVACYLFVVLTNIGHDVRRLMIEGLQCLTALVKTRQYLAAIHSLYYMLPFFVKNSDELLSQTEFINLMSDLIVADMTVLPNISGTVVGAVLHEIAAMIKHQISQASMLTVECATPLIKLWINILLKVLSFLEKNYSLKDSAKQVHFLLDVLMKISCVDDYTRSSMIDLLYSLGNPLLSTPSNSQTTIWTRLFGSNTESYTILKRETLPDYPLLAWFVLKAETKQKQSQDLWFHIQKEIAKDSDMTPPVALKKACCFLKIKQPPLESLPIYRFAQQILRTPVSHPILPLLWQNFFHYFFERISVLESEAPRSLGLNYFKAGHFQILKKLKSRAQETAEYYKSCIENSQDPRLNEFEKKVVSKECIFNFELCSIYRAFSFWIEQTNLHQPNLCFSALGPNYCCERLKQILDNDQNDWFDLVSVDQLKDDLKQKLHSWVRKKKLSVCPQSSSESHEESSVERISRHLKNNKDVKPLECAENITPPMHEIEDIALSSWNVLVQLIESKQGVIFDKARSFTELSSKLKQLNSNYKNLVPQEFVNQDEWETVSKSCYRGLKCAGPASFNLLVKRYIPNQRICEKLENNRMEHSKVQDQLLDLPIHELCIASVHIENYIRALSKKMETAEGEESLQFRKLGICLFYHQLETVNKVIASVKNYTPSQNFFATSIESLGNIFICNEEDQLCALAKAILKYPDAGELAFGIYNPNVASIAVFLELYEILTSAIESCQLNTVFVLLRKIDLNHILKTQGTNYRDRKILFKLICKTLLQCGSSPSKELQMVHDVLTDHFRITLLLAFPEFFEDTISFVLEGMDKNQISASVWRVIFQCFGCSNLNENSPIETIENTLKIYAGRVLLPPNEQMFVSFQPINVKEVLNTLDRFHLKFLNKRTSNNIYEVYGLHVKPFGTFLAVLCHSMLSILNENAQREATNIAQLWQSLHRSFYPWLHPAKKEMHLIFPWSDEKLDCARFMIQMFAVCLRNFHDKLLGYNCEKCILSYFWSSYIEVYVMHGLRHYSVALYHSECLNLPWDQFHPNSEDLEGMCLVLQSNLLESRDFLAKISLKIPWIEIMKSISETMSPEYVRNTLVTLGKLLIISGLDVSLTKSNLHSNNLKALEELSWCLISVDDTEGLLQLYYSTSDPINLLHEEIPNNSDIYVLQFLKIVCCMVVSPISVDYPHSNAKRLIYLHKYITALTTCLCNKKGLMLNNPEKLQKVLPSLFTDIEKVIASERPEQQMSSALPLVNEVIGFLNKINDSKLESMVLDSLLLWLKANPRSPLLLPCLQTACRSLNQMTSAVMIVECCITTRFNTDLHDPSEAHGIWQLIVTCFQIRSSMLDDFIHSCVNKNAFLTLYCYLLDMIPKTTSESRKMLLMRLTDWINRCEVNENDEAKSLLLWDKVLELSIMLANEDNLQIVKTTLSAFCRKLSIFGEDKSSDGFLGAVGLGRSSVLSVNFRFLCRVIVAFILLQIPVNASIRLQPMDPGLLPAAEMKSNNVISSKLMEPSPSPAALEALKNVKVLLKNKPYSALRDLVNSAIEYVVDPSHALSESRILLKEYALHVFPKQYYLYALG